MEQLDNALKELTKDLPREDTQHLKKHQDALQQQWEDLCKQAKESSTQLSEGVSNWQKYQGTMQQMVLWLDTAEPRLEPEANTCASLAQVEKRVADVQVGMSCEMSWTCLEIYVTSLRSLDSIKLMVRLSENVWD